MKIINITWRALFFLVGFSFLIFMIGLYETVREDIMFPIGDELVNPGNTPPEIYADYLESKNSYVFTNQPLTYLANFVGLLLTFWLMVYSWKVGYNSPLMNISQVFGFYNMMLILVLYFGIIISQYIIDVLITQFIKLLWSEIYTNVYMYQLFVEWFVYLLLLAYLFSFLANYIRHFDIIKS